MEIDGSASMKQLPELTKPNIQQHVLFCNLKRELETIIAVFDESPKVAFRI